MLNEIHIIGRLGADPEMRFTPNGNPVANFRVACTRRYYRQEELQEETEWFTVVTWNKLAENCNQHLVKGQLVYVSGRVHQSSWEKQDGSGTGFRIEITAMNVIFLAKPKNGNGNGEPPAESVEAGTPETPDDIPFW